MLMTKEMVKRRRSSIAVIERDFNDALDRLLAGTPRNSKLRKLAAEGRLNINPTTVAAEAGRSRTLIALEDCRLPSVRSRIQSSTRELEVAAPRTAVEVITRLRERVIQLQRELAASIEAQAQHFLARERAEREAAQWRGALRREHDHVLEDAKVAPIRGRGPKN